jgi:hypothetical protein
MASTRPPFVTSRSPCRAHEQWEEVALDPRQDRLRLWIPEAAVELEHPRAVLGQHQPGVEQTREGRVPPRQLGQHRPVNDLEQLFDLWLGEAGYRRVGAHAARVRAGVTLADSLEVLRWSEGHCVLAIAEREQRDLLTLEQLLDQELAAELGRGT